MNTTSFVGVGEWLERRQALTPEKIGLVDADTGERFTYRALNMRARALAALLAGEYGVRQGDRVAALAGNAPAYLDAYFACALLGAILVPLNWRLTVRELATILRDCSPGLLLHDETHRDKAAETVAALNTAPPSPAPSSVSPTPSPLPAASAARRSSSRWPWSRQMTPSTHSTSSAPQLHEPAHMVQSRLLAFDAFPGADAGLAARAVPFQTTEGEDPLLILYTSGTTGVSKGALLSHRMMTWNAINTQVSWGLCDGDSAPISSPFFHAGGLNVLTTPLYHLGGTVVLLRSNDPAAILRTVAAERCTIVFNVPTVFQAMLEHPAFAATDLSSVRFCVTGGSSCPIPVIEGFARRGLVFRQGYGLTEVGVNCFSLAPEDALRKAGSVGRPVFHSRARVVDEQDRDVASGAVGELVLAGPHVCSGYWNRPEATAEAFRGGWWHTGDLVQVDADGYYFIVGRKKDMYISGGENIYPAEIEQLLAQHPAIAEAAVIAQPDPKWGEVGVAVVVPRAPGSLSAEEVLAYLDGKLARFKLPRRVELTDALPRNAMGKVIKAELVERYVTGTSVAVPHAASDAPVGAARVTDAPAAGEGRRMRRPLAARVEPVQETFYGETITDPYRWMEDWQGEEARAWVAAQGEYARQLLDALPERATLLGRIQELTAAASTVINVQAAGGRIFYLRRDPGDNVPKLATRAATGGPERVLLDPNGMSGGDEGHTVIDWYAPARDGSLVAYGISQGGSEESVLHVLAVETGEPLDLAIPLTRFDNVSWLADNRSFLYHRLAELPPGAPPTERYFDSRAYLHRLGDDWRQDTPIFGRGVSEGVEIERADFPFVATTPESPYLIGLVVHGVLSELTLYAAPLAALANPANITWTKIADVDDAVTGFAPHGETIYLLTHKDAPRYKVIATSLAQPDLAAAPVVVPESRLVIEEIRIAGDALLTRDLDAGLGRMRRVPLARAGTGGEPQAVALPFAGTIVEWGGEPGSLDIYVLLTSWTESPRVFHYDARSGAVSDTGIVARSPVDFSEIETHELHAPGKDGTPIPLSLLHKRGLALDGANPTLLTGYGSYGLSLRPAFQPSLLAWLERGGVYAVAHLRGGGEYGKEWHEAGRKLTKQTTIDDFIACAEYLIARGYTRPERLAGEGTSAGGIPSGGALVQRPELWAAMVMRVAVFNMLRFEFSENGPPNVPEFGSLATEEGFRALRIMDAYTKVRDGVAYPAALLTTGLNDPRVVVWQATKMAARLQAATSSDRPILLRVEGQGGHGIGASKRQLDEEQADKYAFLLWQLGITGKPDERPDEA